MEAGTTQEALEKKEASYSVDAYLGKDVPFVYRNMILSKWMRSLKFGNDYFRLIDSDSYYSTYQHYIKALLERPQCIVRLALLPGDELHTCLGFSVSEPGVLHFVWSHKDNRRIGIAKSLIQFPFDTITHLTTSGMAVWHKKFPHAKFNPFK